MNAIENWEHHWCSSILVAINPHQSSIYPIHELASEIRSKILFMVLAIRKPLWNFTTNRNPSKSQNEVHQDQWRVPESNAGGQACSYWFHCYLVSKDWLIVWMYEWTVWSGSDDNVWIEALNARMNRSFVRVPMCNNHTSIQPPLGTMQHSYCWTWLHIFGFDVYAYTVNYLTHPHRMHATAQIKLTFDALYCMKLK